jgi:hypothetical protein
LRPLFLSLLLLAGCSSAGPKSAVDNATQSGVINFADARSGLRLVYPVGWNESDVLPQHTLLLLHRDDESFSIIAQPVGETDLNAMERRAVDKYRGQFEKFELLESSAAKLGALPARRIVFRGNAHGDQLQMMSTLAAAGGQGYAAVYVASPSIFQTGRADAQRIIDSVQFAK